MNHWSDRHRFVLWWMADKLYPIIGRPNGIPKEELVSLGWLYYLRRYPEEELNGHLGYLVRRVYCAVRQLKGRPMQTGLEGFDIEAPTDTLREVEIHDEAEALLRHLRPRQRYIVMEVLRGRTLKDIGDELRITGVTVGYHYHQAMTKLKEVAACRKSNEP